MPHLSKPMRKLAALALLLGALGLLALVTVVPVASRVSELSEQIDTERAVLGRFAAISAQQAETQDRDRIGRLASQSEAYLKGESEPLKAAALQTLLSEFAAADGVRFYSTRTLPARDRDDARLIGVRVQFNGEIEQLRAFLYRVEAHRPFLFIEALQAQPVSPFSQRDPAQNGVLDVRLDVFGALQRQKG
jgi:hypothetical protein